MTDKIWHSEPHSAPPSEGHFNYWPEGLLPLEIDDLGLGLASAPPAAGDATPTQPLHGSPEHEAALRKRKRERADQESVESILAQLGREEEDDSPYEDKRPQRTTSGSHKATAASAARNKACRERQRRERLNDRFAELAKVLEPGKAAKTDKTNIIDDAMRIVTQLRGENGQLRQLNKFLEERVAQCEKAKSELLLQQALMQQSAGLAGGPSQLLANARLFQASPLGPGIVQGVAVGVPAVKPPAPSQAQQLSQQLSQHLQQAQSLQHPLQHPSPPPQGQAQPQPSGPPQTQVQQPAQSGLQSQASLPQPLPPQPLQLQLAVPGGNPLPQTAGPTELGASDSILPFPTPNPFIKQEFSAGLMLPGGLTLAPNMTSWLPPSTLDTSQDSVRRPPAA